MTPDVAMVAAAVGLAVGFLVRLAWRRLAGRRKGCAGGCGCPGKSTRR